MAVYRKKILAVAAKIETTEGVDAAPSLATDALRLVNMPTLTITTVEDGKKNTQQHAGLGHLARNAPKGRVGSVDLVVEVRGKGTAYALVTDYVEADPLLQAAGFAKSYAAGAVSYTTLDTGMVTITLYLYASNGKLFKLVGCIAKGPKLAFLPGQSATMTFTVIGRLTAVPVDASITGLVLNSIMAPLWADTNVTLGAWTVATAAPNQLVPRKASIDVTVTEGMRPWAGANALLGHYISERMVRLALEVEPVALTTFDPYAQAMVDGSVAQTFATQLGPQGNGNSFIAQTGNVAIEQPGDADLSGIAGWTLAGDVAARSIPSGVAAGRELLLQYT